MKNPRIILIKGKKPNIILGDVLDTTKAGGKVTIKLGSNIDLPVSVIALNPGQTIYRDKGDVEIEEVSLENLLKFIKASKTA